MANQTVRLKARPDREMIVQMSAAMASAFVFGLIVMCFIGGMFIAPKEACTFAITAFGLSSLILIIQELRKMFEYKQ